MWASWQLSPCYYFAAFSRLVGGEVIALHFSLTIEARNFSKKFLHHESLISRNFFSDWLEVLWPQTHKSFAPPPYRIQHSEVTLLRWMKWPCWTWYSLICVWNVKIKAFFFPFLSRLDRLPLKLPINCRCMWIWAVEGVCVLVVCRDHAASVWDVAGTDVDAVVRLSAPLCVLARDKSTLVPTELENQNQTGLWDGIVPSLTPIIE